MYRGGQRGSRNSPARNQRIAEQQAVLDRLRSGLGITAKPASPFLAAGRALAGKPDAMGTVYGAELDGKSVLRMPKGMSQSGFLGPINVAGRTYYPAESGEDVIFMQGRQYPGGFGRAANAEEVDDGRVGGLFRGIAAADIGGDGRSDEARALASQYAPKPFPMTPAGQFERYFKTPEMDQYFGAASRGTTAPKDVEAMQALAGKTVAPGKTPEELAGFYRAESAMGRAQMPQIQKGLGYAEGSDLAKWAEANPMLAQRLYAKEMGKREAAGQVTPGVTYAGAPSSIGNENFAVAANAVPAPWDTQGNKVSAPFADVKDSQFAYTTGEGMPALPTTFGQRAEELIRAVKRDRGML